MDRPSLAGADEPRIVMASAAFIVAWKPHRMHCAELGPGGTETASLAAWVFSRHPETAPASFQENGSRPSVDGGLIHRLDYETAGLVLFARSPEALRVLREAQARDAIVKSYRLACAVGDEGLAGSEPRRGCPAGCTEPAWARCLGEGDRLAEILSNETIASYFRPYGPRGARVACIAPAMREGRGRGSRSGRHGASRPRRGSPERLYVTRLRSASGGREGLGASVELTRGFRHQIRAHFAWIGLPLVGDALYGGKESPFLALVATGIDFDDPETGLPLRIRDESIASLRALP